MNAKIQTDPAQYTNAESQIMERAECCGAPIAVAANQVGQRRVYQSLGSRNSPAKQFIDTRSGRKVSISVVRQIIASYEISK